MEQGRPRKWMSHIHILACPSVSLRSHKSLLWLWFLTKEFLNLQGYSEVPKMAFLSHINIVAGTKQRS